MAARHLAGAQQKFFEWLVAIETQQVKLAVATEHGRLARAIIEFDQRAGAARLARAHLHARLMRAEQAFDQDLDATAALLAAIQSRRQDAGIVEHQQIARLQQLRQLAHAPILQQRIAAFFVAARQHQQAARRTLRQRLLRDQLRGQLEMEIRFVQIRFFKRAAAGLERV